MRTAAERLSPTIACLLVLTPASVLAAVPPEVWVVNEVSKTIRMVTTGNPEVLLGDLIPLSGGFPPPAPPMIPAPHGMAFSHLNGVAPARVFVSQGRYLRVIDPVTRTIRRTLNMNQGFPAGVTLLRIKGLAAGRPIRLRSSGNPIIKRYLHAAAMVQTSAGEEAWALVLDQEALVCESPPCPDPYAARVPLGVPGEAMDVALQDVPYGDLRQRAWYTVLEAGPPPRGRVLKLAKSEPLASSWQILESQQTTFSTLTTTPRSLQASAAFDQELPIWGATCSASAGHSTAAVSGCIQNLRDPAGCCPLPGFGTATEIGGAGRQDFTAFGLGEAGLLDGLGTLYEVDSNTCSVKSHPTQAGPTDLLVLDPIRVGKVFVSNYDSDSLTILNTNTQQVRHLSLVPTQGPFVAAPGARAANAFGPLTLAAASAGCVVAGQTESIVNEGGSANVTDVKLTWALPQGCLSTQTWVVVCRCNSSSPGACPSGCPGPTVGVTTFLSGTLEPEEDPDKAGEWGELGVTNLLSFTHFDAGPYTGATEYSIYPDGN